MNKRMKKHLDMPIWVKGEDAVALTAKVREDRVWDGYTPEENCSGSHLVNIVNSDDVEIQNGKKIKLEEPVLASSMETDRCKCKKECGGQRI